MALAAALDEGSAVHLKEHFASVHKAWEVAAGLWFALRGLWVFVALGPALLLTRGRAVQAGLLLLAITATVAANVPIAHDLSRSPSTMVPAAMLGIILLVRARPSPAAWTLTAALALNLLTPARHVVEGWDATRRIRPLYIELDHLNRPPKALAILHVTRASTFTDHGDLRNAFAEVDKALQIDPTAAAAHFLRGMLLDGLGKPVEAAACYDAAIHFAPQVPEGYAQRARFRLAQGQFAAAQQDLGTAIDLLPARSPARRRLNASSPKYAGEMASVIGKCGHDRGMKVSGSSTACLLVHCIRCGAPFVICNIRATSRAPECYSDSTSGVGDNHWANGSLGIAKSLISARKSSRSRAGQARESVLYASGLR